VWPEDREMARLIGDPAKALLTKPMMARGCELCFPGEKAVIFVTGLCDDGCYYCPVNREKLGRDVFYVNEEPVTSIEEAIIEVARTGATSASLTGGDPLARPDRTLILIKALKEHFGPQFHIHLYTSGRYLTPDLARALARAGLDEIRFHPTRDVFLDRIPLAVRAGMDVGVEIPVGPGLVEWAKKVLAEAEKRGARFANLNELEFVEPNARELLSRGLRESRRRPFTVEGAYEAALQVLEWAAENLSIPVHFCPATYKDRVQTLNRLRRTARTDAAWYEEPGPAGTLAYGITIHGERVPPRPEALCREGGGRIVEAYPTRARWPRVSEEPVQCG